MNYISIKILNVSLFLYFPPLSLLLSLISHTLVFLYLHHRHVNIGKQSITRENKASQHNFFEILFVTALDTLNGETTETICHLVPSTDSHRGPALSFLSLLSVIFRPHLVLMLMCIKERTQLVIPQFKSLPTSVGKPQQCQVT